MVVVGEAFVEPAVLNSSFCCDLPTCKGGCCYIEGGRGAPLEDDEVLEIAKSFPFVKEFLSDRSIRIIESGGVVEGRPGNYATPCIDDRDCVFLVRDDGIARCGFEKAFELGKTDWRKPISCHLFPLRIRGFEKNRVVYEVIDECSGGRALGEREDLKLHVFLKDALTRQYGEEWYNEFVEVCKAKGQ